MSPNFCCAPRTSQGRTFLRQAPGGASREDAKLLADGSIPAAAAGQQDSDNTAAAPVGAGAIHGRKWSPEALNRHSGCQKGGLDGCTESDPSEQNNTMHSHGAFLHFQIDVTGLLKW